MRDPGLLAECAELQRALGHFPSLAALRSAPEWPELRGRFARLLSTIRRYAPAVPPPSATDGTRVRAVHWNIEHGNWYEQVEHALLHQSALKDADLLFFNEIDLGMARAGNRDVTDDLAAALGRYAVWTPLFLETTRGRDDDLRMAGALRNQEGLFGIAILSRWPIGDVRVVELPSPELIQFDLERMYGRHVGLVATIERPGAPFLAISAHLEVHRGRRHRAAQVRALLDALATERLPIVLAGDFNTHTFDRGSRLSPLIGAVALVLSPAQALERRLLYPDRGPQHESLFDALRSAGFEWDPFVDRAPTLQLRFDRIEEAQQLFGPFTGIARRVLAWAERRGRLRLDWFVGRGWGGGTGTTVLGLDGPGKASDHAPIVAEFIDAE